MDVRSLVKQSSFVETLCSAKSEAKIKCKLLEDHLKISNNNLIEFDFHFPIMQFVFHTKFCINIVFNFLWGLTVANKTYAKFCGEDKLHHGERVRW